MINVNFRAPNFTPAQKPQAAKGADKVGFGEVLSFQLQNPGYKFIEPKYPTTIYAVDDEPNYEIERQPRGESNGNGRVSCKVTTNGKKGGRVTLSFEITKDGMVPDFDPAPLS